MRLRHKTSTIQWKMETPLIAVASAPSLSLNFLSPSLVTNTKPPSACDLYVAQTCRRERLAHSKPQFGLMETKLNGIQKPAFPVPATNGHTDDFLIRGLEDEPSSEELESELPVVDEGQVPLGELLSRVVQSIYAELTEMAETLPGMSDQARKRTIADWVVKTKKQVVKLYAVMKWSRDAEDVQKAMNITAFLMDQNQQFEDAVQAITAVKESLAPARLRNHDLLTSLDVLTTGTYLRLPSQIKKFFITPPPLTDEQVAKTLQDMEDHIRYRLRMSEIIPIEMSRYRIDNGRVHFIVPDLFETSISLRGAQKDDGWFFVHMEFLHNVGGDLTEVQDFPRRPTDILKRHITDEADARLAYYIPLPPDPNAPPDYVPPPRPQLPHGTVDAPLVRLFNFLQMMSLSYQLEILFFQAQRLRALGWRDYLTLEKARDGKSFSASYWIRPAPTGRQIPNQNRPKVPLIGGTVTVSLVETRCSQRAGSGPKRNPKDRILAALQRESKIGSARPSDEVETFRIEVKWEPTKGALGVSTRPDLVTPDPGELDIDPQDVNFETILRRAIARHVVAILTIYQTSLQTGPLRVMFSAPGEVMLQVEDGYTVLRVHLCADEYMTVSIDPRTGRITLRDTGGLSASGRAPRLALISDRLNESPYLIYDVLATARFTTIIELAEQKAQYLGLQTFRTRNLSLEELRKFGPDVRAYLFVQLAGSQKYYLVLLITDVEIRFALICIQVLESSPTGNMILEDIAWLDVSRIHSADNAQIDPLNSSGRGSRDLSGSSMIGGFSMDIGVDRFMLETQVLREVYAYCCARVAYTKVESQLKLRGIPYSYLDPVTTASLSPEMSYLQSSLARSIPGLCVQSSDILAGAPAAEAAMPNIRIVPLNWWSTSKSQVVTSVKLKYVQQPVGKHAGTTTIIRPSKRIVYDTREAVVTFLSENVDTCVDEFLEEWAKVSKIVVLAREVAQMSKQKSWAGVQLISFDLQTVEFAYAKDYTVSIKCTNQLLPPSPTSYDLSFSRIRRRLGRTLAVEGIPGQNGVDDEDLFNPHEDAEPFLKNILRQGQNLSSSLHQLVGLLRDSLPLVCTIESIRQNVDAAREKDSREPSVDVIPKAAGWFRVVYANFGYALDFRLMTGRRAAILDAGSTLSDLAPRKRIPADSFKNAPRPSEKFSNANDSASGYNILDGQAGMLQTIPNFSSLVREAVRDALDTNASHPMSSVPALPTVTSEDVPLKPMRIAQIGAGLICDVDDLEKFADGVHRRILRSLSMAHGANQQRER